MKFHNLLRILREEPLLITPAAHRSILSLVESRIFAVENAPERAPGEDGCGGKVEVESMVVDDNGIAHIPIAGVIGQKLGAFERGAGAVDVLDIAKDVAYAERSNDVVAVLFDIDSPGGMVSGTPELANKIAAIEKPTYAYSNGQICSAAYWLAASCDEIFATPTADVGSIGVYIPWIDLTAYYDREGISVDLIKSGKFKGMGYPGTSLTDDQRKLLQERVDSIAEMFYGHVLANRYDVEDDSMQGQTFMGEDAANRGLLSLVVQDKDEVLSMILS